MRPESYQQRSNEIHNALMDGTITPSEAYDARQELVDVLRRKREEESDD
jgi:hypothetical protein